MSVIISYIVYLLWIFSVESTDIAAVYHHGILLLKNVDQMTNSTTPQAQTLQLPLQRKLNFPIGLTYDPLQRRLLVADSNSDDTKVLSVPMKKPPFNVEPLVLELGQSIVDGLTYDPSDDLIFWTDAANHGIYFANLSDVDQSVQLLTKAHVKKPRGITFDYCNKTVYWTEREDKRPSIEKYDMVEKSQIALDIGKNHTYYQTVDYNGLTKEIIWAESKGSTVDRSSCRFIVKSLETGKETTLTSFENCFPYALTSDKDYIYWSDWVKHGIMRMSRKDPQHSLVKLVDTPEVKSGAHTFKGAYGIVNLRDISAEDATCYERKLRHFGYRGEESATEISLSPPESSDAATLPSVKAKDALGANEPIVSSAFNGDSDVTNTVIYRQQRLIIICLALTCSIFMSTTVVLLLRSCSGGQIPLQKVKKFFATIPASPITSKPKRAKPHRRFGPKTKSLEDGHLCRRSADDGIKIDIEDCCQMTLCETPCYTTVKKEGKGYSNLKKSKSPSKAGDKQQLLDDIETA